jgi:N-acetylmuramic acid 6-phosphate etherase
MVIGIIAGGDAALRHAVEGAEDSFDDGAHAIGEHDVGERDVVVGIATSGRTPYVLGALQEAHRRKAKTVLLSCTPPDEALGEYVDGFITPLVGGEIIAGSTRLKAGTATKLVLNQLTTTAMIRLGKVYDNWMVDLQATNSKLRDRARRLVRDIARVDEETAERVLARCGGSVKTALVVLRRGVSPEEARALLDAHGGRLREIIG